MLLLNFLHHKIYKGVENTHKNKQYNRVPTEEKTVITRFLRNSSEL